VRAKASWGYDKEDMAAFAPSLLVNGEYVAANEVWVGHDSTERQGWYAIEVTDDRAELEYFWVAPEAQGKGVGRALWRHAMARAEALGARVMGVQADPFAQPFYERMGATFQRDTESDALPGRKLPYLEAAVPDPDQE